MVDMVRGMVRGMAPTVRMARITSLESLTRFPSREPRCKTPKPLPMFAHTIWM